MSPLFLVLFIWLAYEIKQARKGKSKYGFFRRFFGNLLTPAMTLAAISERGPKFIYLDDFTFNMTNESYGGCKLRLRTLIGGEDITNEFEGKTPSECLTLFFDWYDKNRETLVDAKESLAKIRQLKRNLSR
jgi:hypothetical protein